MIRRLLDRYLGALRATDWIPSLVARLYFGHAIFVAGKGKLFGDMDGVTSYFADLGIPFPAANAYLAAGTELAGGLLLIAGLGTRLAALPLAITMIVAFATAHWQNVDDFASFLGETPGPFLIAFVYLLFAGPGKASLDHVIRRRFGR